MPSRLTQLRVRLFPKVAASLGVIAFLTGSVAVIAVPHLDSVRSQKVDEPDPLASYSLFPRPELLPDYTPPKVKPRATTTPPKTTPLPSPSASSGTVQPSRSDDPVPRKSDPVKPSSSPTKKATPTPTPKPASTPPKPTPTATVPPANNELRAQVISLINQKRAQAGVNAVSSNSVLFGQCQKWSTSMASKRVLQHSTMNYGGEIIASGPTTAQAVVDLWLNSPPHREIMLSSRYTTAGAGYVNGYWTVQFA
jgi:uncharacterized protein YkwD